MPRNIWQKQNMLTVIESKSEMTEQPVGFYVPSYYCSVSFFFCVASNSYLEVLTES